MNPLQKLWYSFCQTVLQAVVVSYFRFRTFHKKGIPLTGSLLLVSNHQSMLDPIFATVGLPRNCSFLARASLFRNPFFACLIRSLNAFPLEKSEGKGDPLENGVQLLEAGKAFLIFPEGTRSSDGKLQRFRLGAARFALQTQAPILPLYIQGAHRALKKGGFPLPLPTPIHIHYGKILYPEDYKELPAPALTQKLFQEISRLQEEAEEKLKKKNSSLEEKIF
jgi:1-acyl-sn-glycerol-3-phosphate acyltransferase